MQLDSPAKMLHARADVVAAATVTLAAVLPYLSTLGAYFACDDFSLIQLFADKPLWYFLTLFTRQWTDMIYGFRQDELRPFLALSYQLDSLWGVTSPEPYRVTNILLHALTSLLVFAIGRYVVHLPSAGAALSGVAFAVLPTNVEAVTWISGRADSQPAVTYLMTFLLYALWRRTGSRALYGLSVAAFFVALYSKQHAITMPVTIVLYDVLAERRPLEFSRKALAPYLPFIVLTLFYLGMRYVLFDTLVREQRLSLSSISVFLLLQATYFQMLLTGIQSVRTDAVSIALGVGVLLFMAGTVLVEFFWGKAAAARSPRATVVYFGAAWWGIQIAPLIVTYVSARHLYLPAAGYAIVLGLAYTVLQDRSGQRWRFAAPALALLLVASSLLILRPLIDGWKRDAALSEAMTRATHREAASAPAGSLLVLGAPGSGDDPANFTWVWAFGVPALVQPPWAERDLTQHVTFVGGSNTYCCPMEQWERDTRGRILEWAARLDQPPVIVLDWDHATHQMTRRTERDAPDLRARVLRLAEAPDARAMQRALEELAPGAATGTRYAELRQR